MAKSKRFKGGFLWFSGFYRVFLGSFVENLFSAIKAAGVPVTDKPESEDNSVHFI